MSIERENTPERVQVLPSVTRETVLEVLSEMAIGRSNFASRATAILLEENPDLAQAIIPTSHLMPDPETGLLWSLALYECYSRESRKEGKQTFRVSVKVMETLGLEILKRHGLPEETSTLSDREKEKLGKAMDEEDYKTLEDIVNQSRPMDILLTAFLSSAEQESIFKKSAAKFYSLTLLFNTFRVLRAQEEANRRRN